MTSKAFTPKSGHHAIDRFVLCPVLHNGKTYSVTAIKDRAFRDNQILTGSLTIGISVITIGNYAFINCKGLTGSLIIGNSVTTIGNGAFSDCSGFTGPLTIPNSVTSIGSSAFARCSGLTGSLTIPNSVTTIGNSAFSGCSGFTGSLTIPNSVTSIGNSAFSGCSGFTGSLTIGKGVKTIGYQSFYFTSFAEITSLAVEPPVIDDGGKGYKAFSSTQYKKPLYVPAGSVEAYKVAYDWKDFFKILPEGYVEETGISLDKEEMNVNVGGTGTVVATVTPADATEKTVTWSTSDATVATVDADGKVTGVKEGTATVTATTANGLTATCKVTVLPRLATGITLDRNEVETVVGKSFGLNAEILPADAVQQAAWSSSDEAVVMVSQTGEVEVKGQGTALITASTTDGSGLSATCEVTAWLLGDTNGDGTVDIADVVNTTNYIAGNDVDRFVFVAGDINGDEDITVTDAVQIARIILAADSGAESAPRRARAFSTDYMTADCAGNTVALALSAGGYSAFQADVRLPHGVELTEALAGAGCSASHTVMTAVRGDNTVRVVVFSLANEEFGAPGNAVVELRLSGRASEGDKVEVGNIVVSDASGKSSTMECRVSGDMSGIAATADGNGIGIRAVDGGVEVTGACGQAVRVFTPDGMQVCSVMASADVENIRLAGGVYVVAVDGSVKKIVVK